MTLTLDEFEAVRLADFEGLYHAAAADRMGISRPTFGRIVEAARHKIALALVHGRALAIAGGPVAAVGFTECSHTTVLACGHGWPGPGPCPRCSPDCPQRSAEPAHPTAGRPCQGRRRRCRRGG